MSVGCRPQIVTDCKRFSNYFKKYYLILDNVYLFIFGALKIRSLIPTLFVQFTLKKNKLMLKGLSLPYSNVNLATVC